jgi:hypothetical protein
LPSRLPDELRERHTRLYDKAITSAKAKGWDAQMEDDDD